MKPTLYKESTEFASPSRVKRIIRSRWAKMRLDGKFKGLTPYECHELRTDVIGDDRVANGSGDYTLLNESRMIQSREEAKLSQ